MGKKNQDPDPGSGSGMNNSDHISGELKNNFFGLKYLNSCMRIRDPEWKKFGSGMEKVGSWIRYKHPRSATLLIHARIAPRALGLELVDLDPDLGESELRILLSNKNIFKTLSGSGTVFSCGYGQINADPNTGIMAEMVLTCRMLNKKLTMKDIESIDPEFFNSIVWIRQGLVLIVPTVFS
jgi:hypothetical protein